MKGFVAFFLFSTLFLSPFIQVNASHNRAGEITYEWVAGSTYKLTVTTYTKDESPADRCELEVNWGDGNLDTLYRVNGILGNECPTNVGDGELVATNIRKNIYIGYHTYPGPGIYTITMLDPNRNEGIVNMLDSFNTPFFLETILLIGDASTGLDTNSSPTLLIPPIDNACSGKLFIHNAGAYDPNGDSLSYALTNCLEMYNQVIPGFYIPSDITINPISGDLVWDTPPSVINTNKGFDEYNVCFEIIEWRNGVIIGKVLRDMQITVVECTNNPPEILGSDTCVLAMSTITDTITATDPDGDNITLTASGGPLIISNTPASFIVLSSGSNASGEFKWETNCSHVRAQPYSVTFKAEDNNPEVSLVDMQTVQITVVGPAPENVIPSAFGNQIQISWDPSVCQEVIGYNIYRRNGPYPGVINCPCETGIPSASGYALIETVSGINTTTYIDNDDGAGLVHGIDYCYRIVALFPDGAESCASEEVCQQLKKDVPIITHVSVGNTDINNGRDTIIWSKPTEIDTLSIYTGPYHYNIYRSPGFTSASTYIGATTPATLLANADTLFIDTGINTQDQPYSYRIELVSGTDTVGRTHIASSVFLSTAPSDNQLLLTWQENIPWINDEYIVYKFDDALSAFTVLDTVSTPHYADTGLKNGKEYCYYIKSMGGYSTSGIVDPIINYSQIRCDAPIDLTPPCAPTISAFGDCENFHVTLYWNNPNNSCADDVAQYNLYYTPVLGNDMNLLQSFSFASDTSFTFTNSNSIAGCYAITALDSNLNESTLSDSICIDNCPIYELPNVFSPDNNLINDLLIPFPYRYVKKINLKIFDRWGQLVFETEDPDINWDGTYMANNKQCSEGVYFYVCYVDVIHLAGIRTLDLTGFVHLLRGRSLKNK